MLASRPSLRCAVSSVAAAPLPPLPFVTGGKALHPGLEVGVRAVAVTGVLSAAAAAAALVVSTTEAKTGALSPGGPAAVVTAVNNSGGGGSGGGCSIRYRWLGLDASPVPPQQLERENIADLGGSGHRARAHQTQLAGDDGREAQRAGRRAPAEGGGERGGVRMWVCEQGGWH